MSYLKPSLMTTAGLLALVASGHAYAQNAAPPAPTPQTDASTAEPSQDGIGDIIVTAQKRSENLQDVPIAVSAFSQDTLTSRGLVGGGDLQQAIPNVSFSTGAYNKSNFQIRGIGAQIQGASVDTGVGVHQNNVPLTSSRLAEAEYFDIERVEVLRGPQGTLYGRNATGGVLNVITNKPGKNFSGEVTAEYGNYDTKRLRGYLNIPITDTLAIRGAGTLIKRDGLLFNRATGNDIDSRDIWSTRLTLGWKPAPGVRLYALWEHFDEDDTRGGGKVLCAQRPLPTAVGGVPTNPFTAELISPGCVNNRIGDASNNSAPSSLTTLPGLFGALIGVQPFNSFAGARVSSDIREVSTDLDPAYNARSDVFIGQAEIDVTDTLTFTLLGSYNKDRFRQFNSLFSALPTIGFLTTPLTPGGSFTDPQLGTSDRLRAASLTRQTSRQFSQEARLQSNFSGPINFSVGGIYLDYKQDLEVIALGNVTTATALAQNAGGAGIYIDPLSEPDGTGHSYYNNFSPYRLHSAAAFGELYWQTTETLKATLGLRYTNDLKKQITYPVLLLTPGRGFPVVAESRVRFQELTGRFTVDWQPEISFTNSSLFYASASRGYKGGGFNPGAGANAGVRATFDPEFINAFELGTKNTLLDRRLTLNLTGFYYDYKGYQVARIANQTVNNENIDATVKGLEFEAVAEPVRGLRFNTSIGYLDSSIRNTTSVDLLNRTQGDPALTVVRSLDPAAGFASNCVVPTALAAATQAAINAGSAPPVAIGFLCSNPAASGGVPVNLRGNELPYATPWTLSIGAEYGGHFTSDLSATLRADYYRQGRSFARIYNSTADRIESWDNLNFSLRVASETLGTELLLYARNLLSKNDIISISLGDDATGGARTARGKEPPAYGVALTKRF